MGSPSAETAPVSPPKQIAAKPGLPSMPVVPGARNAQPVNQT